MASLYHKINCWLLSLQTGTKYTFTKTINETGQTVFRYHAGDSIFGANKMFMTMTRNIKRGVYASAALGILFLVGKGIQSGKNRVVGMMNKKNENQNTMTM
jgi:hypothetical protein